jgi:nicotinate phosphoribosyltransferase
VFDDTFLGWLRDVGGFGEVTMWAVPEGRVIHPNTPVATVQAPLAVAQLLETALLNHLNYPTLIATKASRVAEAASGGAVMEFGARRGPAEGTNAGTRAALIGGAGSSSNVGISLDLGLTPAGTHAHSMVQAFIATAGGELEAFRAYAAVYPEDCLLLVDTIDTLESGLPNAITVFSELRADGHEPVGIRLDSGDLAYLAVRSAKMLDDAGFPNAGIVLSSSLDEITIWQIRNQIVEEAPRWDVDADSVLGRLLFGVGSKMISSHGDPTLDGVYKLVALEDASGAWTPAIKVSDSPEKVIDPGRKLLWRVYDERGTATADLMTLSEVEVAVRPLELRHRTQSGAFRRLDDETISDIEQLSIQVLDRGRRVADLGEVEEARARRRQDLERLDPGVRRIVNPHTYHVSLSRELWDLKTRLVSELTEGT